MVYTIDTKSGLYTLAKNSRSVSKQTPVTATKPTTTNKYTAVLQAQAAAGTAKPSVAGETATRQAQYAAVLNQNVNPGAAKASVAGENAGLAIQNNPATTKAAEPVYTPVAAATTTQPAAATNTQTAAEPVYGTVAQTVTYIDENGEKQQGVVEVPETETDYWTRMKETYEKQLEEAIAANDAQTALAAERARASAEERIAALDQQYAGTNRQLYRDYMMTQKALPQQMSAQGYSGGLSESARLRLGTSYQEALAENERARIAGVAGINSERDQSIYEIEAARAEADRNAQLQRDQALLALEQEQRQYAMAKAEQMASLGDFSGFLDLGYTAEEVERMRKAWIAANPDLAVALGMVAEPAATSGGGGGGGYYTTPTTTNSKYTELLQAQASANEAARGGATYTEIAAELNDMANKGEISTTTANAVKQSLTNPTAGLGTSELNAMSTRRNTNNTSKVGSFLNNLGNAILSGINN